MSDDVRSVAIPALELLTQTADRLSPGDHRRMSNLAGWRVSDLVAHVTASVHRAAVLTEEGTLPTTRTDREDWFVDEPAAALREQSDRFLTALEGADQTRTVQGPLGEQPLAQALALPVSTSRSRIAAGSSSTPRSSATEAIWATAPATIGEADEVPENWSV